MRLILVLSSWMKFGTVIVVIVLWLWNNVVVQLQWLFSQLWVFATHPEVGSFERSSLGCSDSIALMGSFCERVDLESLISGGRDVGLSLGLGRLGLDLRLSLGRARGLVPGHDDRHRGLAVGPAFEDDGLDLSSRGRGLEHQPSAELTLAEGRPQLVEAVAVAVQVFRTLRRARVRVPLGDRQRRAAAVATADVMAAPRRAEPWAGPDLLAGAPAVRGLQPRHGRDHLLRPRRRQQRAPELNGLMIIKYLILYATILKIIFEPLPGTFIYNNTK